MNYALCTILLTLALLFGSSASAGEFALTDEAYDTLASLQKVDEELYTMEYHGDYALDALLEEGAGSMEALGKQISRQVLYGLPFQHPVIRLACSTFAAETPDGDHIMGRNMDLSTAQNIIVRTTPENGYASLSMASGELLGYVDPVPDSMVGQLHLLAAPYFPLDGINETGFSISIMMLTDDPVHQDTGKTDITTTMVIRMLLDKAASVEEAIALLEGYDLHTIANTNFHYLMADASGDSAVIEYVEGKMQVLRQEPYGQISTNFYLSPDVHEEERDGGDRFDVLKAAMDENKGIVTYDQAWKMLESAQMNDEYDEATGIHFFTGYSIVYNNSQHTMDVVVNMDWGTVYSYSVKGVF